MENNMEQIVDSFFDDATSFINKSLSHMSIKGKSVEFPHNIIIMGAGGTSSWFAPKLTKIINDAFSKNLISNDGSTKFNIVYVDGDVIEEKNLIRQNFIRNDVTKNKAEVISNRYGAQFLPDINCGYINKYLFNGKYRKVKGDVAEKFLDINHVNLFKNISRKDYLIINLIDNAKTRKDIHLTAMDARSAVVIDVANNEYNGQLTTSLYRTRTRELDSYKSFFYNTLSAQLDDNDDVTVFSCADADSDATDQLFNANDMAASILSNYVNDWVVSGLLPYGRVDFVTGKNISVTRSNPFFDTAFITLGYYGPGNDNTTIALNQMQSEVGINEELPTSLYSYMHDQMNIYKERIQESLG